MAVVRQIIGRPTLSLELGASRAEAPETLSLEERLAYLRRRRRPNWLFWTLTTIGVIAILGWLLAEAVGLFQSA